MAFFAFEGYKIYLNINSRSSTMINSHLLQLGKANNIPET